MKYTAKKSVSEVVIDLEDGCVITLTKFNIEQVNFNVEQGLFTNLIYNVWVEMTNGIVFKLKDCGEPIFKDIKLLISN